MRLSWSVAHNVGPETSHPSVLEIRDAIREDRPCSTCLVNYKKDGTKFWNA